MGQLQQRQNAIADYGDDVFTDSLLSLFQASRPISMKKESIQSRNRKLSAKARKKHSSFTSAADMLKPLEKMYGYGMAGMTNAAAMSSYYMPNTGAAAAASIPSLHNSASPSAVSAAASHQYAAAAGMHMMAASTLGGFGAAAAPSFGGMVSGVPAIEMMTQARPKRRSVRNAAVAPNRPFSLESAHAQHARTRGREGAGFKRAHGTWHGSRQAGSKAGAGRQAGRRRCCAAVSQSTFEARRAQPYNQYSSLQEFETEVRAAGGRPREVVPLSR